ncbi:MAG: leucyl/phenylalanyl-tRNA--protein transferase [Bacteroidetes bacterium]|nr:leucyl/phenylalanyl-tRNA--protein transferase [Bacteroidota bacterium]
MPVYLLAEEPVFPSPSKAEPDGLLAIGGDLSPERLMKAYSEGIFPWFRDNDDIFWFSPDPRLILFPEKLRVSPSLMRVIRSGKFEVRIDSAFKEVITACAEAPREGQDGTWIDEEFIRGYTMLHTMGFAHSFESYLDGDLVGGLYGVSIGRAFFGESMFHKVTDASKVAFFFMTEKIKTWQFHFIDCQVETDLLKRLGARSVPRSEYLERLKKATGFQTQKGRWTL